MSESADPEPTKDRPYHHGDLRAAALLQAMRIVESGGAQKLSLREIGAQLGVTHKALYRHFPSKAALLAAVAAQGFHELAADLRGAAPNPDGFCRAYLHFALSRPGLYSLMLGGRSETPAQARGPEVADALAAVIETARGVWSEDEEIKRTWMLLHGGATLHSAGALESRDHQEFVAFMIGLAQQKRS